MALETLIGDDGEEIDLGPYVAVNHETNEITFKIQSGPIKENGLNGCQVVDMIRTSFYIIEGLNRRFPCIENDQTLDALMLALGWQERRTLNRVARGIEGRSEV